MRAEDIKIEDSIMPKFSSLLDDGNIEMLGVTPQYDGKECVMYIGFGVNDEQNRSGYFYVNLTLDGKWWMSIDDRRPAKKKQLLDLFQTDFFDDMENYFSRMLNLFQRDPEEADFTWIEDGTGKKFQNGTFEDHKEEFEKAKEAFVNPEKHIDLGLMKESEVDECDGGGAAGAGIAAGGDAGGTSVGDSGAVSSPISSQDVLGKFDSEKGVMGKGDFHIPAKIKVPKYHLAGNGGGSVRKKDKNGKLKTYYPEKGMKIINGSESDMIEEALKAKTKEVENKIVHCKIKEKSKLQLKKPMKKDIEKPSKAMKASKIKKIKLSASEKASLKTYGNVVTIQCNEDIDSYCLGDIVEASKNKHYKVISKKFMKDINEFPMKEMLTDREFIKYKGCDKLAMLILAPVGLFTESAFAVKNESEKMDEAWGPKPQTVEKKYQEDGFNFIVKVTSGKRRPSPNERSMYGSSNWIPFKMRYIFWIDDPTKKFNGRLYNDFGNIVLEPDFDGMSESSWQKQANLSDEARDRLYSAAKNALQKSKKEI